MSTLNIFASLRMRTVICILVVLGLIVEHGMGNKQRQYGTGKNMIVLSDPELELNIEEFEGVFFRTRKVEIINFTVFFNT